MTDPANSSPLAWGPTPLMPRSRPAMDDPSWSLTIDSLDLYPLPSWVLRSKGCRVDHANRAALQLLKEGRWVRLQADRLVALGDLDINMLDRLLQQPGDDARRLVSHQLKSQASIELATLHVAPIEARSLYRAAWPHADVLLVLERPPRPDDLAGSIGSHVSSRYGLTEMETQVTCSDFSNR